MNYLELALASFFLLGLWGCLFKLASLKVPPIDLLLLMGIAMVAVTISCKALLHQFSVPLEISSLYAVFAGIVVVLGEFLRIRALSVGDASVVFPITGLFIVIPTIFGLLFFQEALSTTKALGIVLAGIAIFLISR